MTDSHFLISKLTTVFKTVWYLDKDIDQWNRIEIPEIKSYIYGHLVFHKSGKTIQWGKNKLSNKWCYFSDRIHGSRNQGVGMRVVPLTITPSNPLAKFLLPALMTLYSRLAGLEVLVPKRKKLLPGDTATIPLHWKLRLPPSTSGFSCL